MTMAADKKKPVAEEAPKESAVVSTADAKKNVYDMSAGESLPPQKKAGE